jgi:hypothetical protein
MEHKTCPKYALFLPESVVVLSCIFNKTTIDILPTGIKSGCNILCEFTIYYCEYLKRLNRSVERITIYSFPTSTWLEIYLLHDAFSSEGVYETKASSYQKNIKYY